MTRRALIIVASLLFLLTFSSSSDSRTEQPTHAFILTQRALLRVELPGGRPLVTSDIPPDTILKVVNAGRFVFLQRKRNIEVLRERTLQKMKVIELPDEIKDIAARGDFLVVATGQRETPGTVVPGEGFIHIFRVGNDGSTNKVRSLRVPKPVHDVILRGTSLYAIDDVVTPVYAHYVDLRRPESATLTTISWDGVYAHFVSQDVADKWYVFGTRWSGPMNRWMTEALLTLPLRPPLRFLNRVQTQYPSHIHNAPAEFRVRAGFLYWADEGVNEMQLVRRALDRVDKQPLAPLGPSIRPRSARKGTIEIVGSRLYVVAHRELVAFELSGRQSPKGFLRIPIESRIISFALATH